MAKARSKDADQFNDGTVVGLDRAFATVLLRLRQAKGLSQQQLAIDSGLGRPFISLLERAQRKPSLESIFLLSQPLGVPPSDIVKMIETALDERTR